MQAVMLLTTMIVSCLLVILPILQNVTAKEFKCDFDICDTDDFQYCDLDDKRCGVCDCDGQSVIPQCEEICKKKNICKSNPCENSGTCSVNTKNTKGFTCNCTAEFTGPTCNTESACSPNPCQNGGNCFLHNGGYICKCPDGYTGTNCRTGSGDGTNYIAVIVTVILVLLVISIGLLVLYLYHEKKLCFSQSTADASAASSANSLLNKSGGIAQDESPIDIKKKLPIPAEGEALLEQHITNPTADMNSNQHQKVYNPSGITYEMIDESDIKEQTNIKHV